MHWTTTLLLSVALTSADGGTPAPAKLEVHATGFRHARGHAEAKLYLEGQDVLKEPARRLRSAIDGGAASFVFEGLAPGAYAVVVFHDENDNELIDHSVIHLPAEPLGFSNGFALGLFSGKPTFEKLRFTVGPKTTRLEVAMH
jgi:uncharacterized protein (DUF2141 family)